ncbi:secretin N-terminal domain-containing protein [Candidatus Uabimicrobium sp. HlEnr_7]|uniref:secretin N-terminal domain-containing protein n=1 Tax=Candidatus Uabimicrobium helgolandensis TaxID=3095367 RepID=UPI0035578DFE
MFRVYTFITIIMIVLCAQNDIKTSEVNLRTFIDHVAKKTGKTLIYDLSVSSKKLHIANIKAESSEELLSILHSYLEFNGYFIEKVGEGNSEVLKIKRSIQGPWTSTPLIYNKEELDAVARTDRFITMVIDLKYISSREVQTTLRALRIINPQGGNLAGIEGSNALLVTDYAPNVKRVYEVVSRMDRKKNVDIIDQKFAIENKTISVKLTDGNSHYLSIKLSKNISVVVKDENDNILANGNGSHSRLWLNHHMQNSVSKKIQIELEALRQDYSEIEVKISKEDNKKDKVIWDFSAFRTLAKGKMIKFTLLLSAK